MEIFSFRGIFLTREQPIDKEGHDPKNPFSSFPIIPCSSPSLQRIGAKPFVFRNCRNFPTDANRDLLGNISDGSRDISDAAPKMRLRGDNPEDINFFAPCPLYCAARQLPS
jgi:hypothetical protein